MGEMSQEKLSKAAKCAAPVEKQKEDNDCGRDFVGDSANKLPAAPGLKRRQHVLSAALHPQTSSPEPPYACAAPAAATAGCQYGIGGKGSDIARSSSVRRQREL